MDQVPFLGKEHDRRTIQQMVALYGAPAFARRAHQVHEALNGLLGRCRQQREEWLQFVRIRLGVLHAQAGDWPALRRWLRGEAQLDTLRRLHEDLRPALRVPVKQTSSPRVLRRSLAELVASLERFNRRWQEYVAEADLGDVNELREGYNRYYVLEKECAVHLPHLARQGFRPLPPLTAADLTALLPPLPVPLLAP
jgi:hypothetical protein